MGVETSGNGAANGASTTEEPTAVTGGRASNLFKLLGFMFLAIVLLFGTDALEIKSTINGGQFKTGLVVKRSTNSTTSTPKAAASGKKKKFGKQQQQQQPPPTVSARVPYKRRGQPLTDDEHLAMVEKWGTWGWDEEKDRPTLDDVYAKYPNRDVPYKQFPSKAWQTDKAYVSRFLQEGQDLVMRAMEAILAEYGHGVGVDEEPGGVSFANRSLMFTLRTHDEDFIRSTMLDKKWSGGHDGGWTTKASWAGLQRRLLHAVMTEDSFIFAMGGHSSAAGHGYV
jgi:hypothetical protein